jgi:hypothetical protein
MEKTVKIRLSLLAGKYIGDRASVLVTEDSNVFYTENFNKCQNYCIPRGIEFVEITKAEIKEAEGVTEKPQAKEETTEAQPKKVRRKRTNKQN